MLTFTIMAGTAGKIGGKRKIWFTKLIVETFPSGNITGLINTGGKGDASKEIRVSSPWKAGKSKNKF